MRVDVEENPRGPRVSLLRLEFHFFFLAIFWVRPAFFFMQIWRLQSSSILPLHFVFVLRRQIVHLFFVIRLFLPLFFIIRLFLPLFFVIRFVLLQCVVLQVPKLSLKDSVLLFRTRVCKTWDLSGIILPTHRVGIESLIHEF